MAKFIRRLIFNIYIFNIFNILSKKKKRNLSSYHLCGSISKYLVFLISGILEREDRENARHILSISSLGPVSSGLGFVAYVMGFLRDKSFT